MGCGGHTSCWCLKNGVWLVFAAGESVCQGTLCAKHQTLEEIGVLSGVRRADFMPMFEEWSVEGQC